MKFLSNLFFEKNVVDFAENIKINYHITEITVYFNFNFMNLNFSFYVMNFND